MAIDPITLSIVTGLAASALYNGIQVTAQRLVRGITDEEKEELRKVYEIAFSKTFADQLSNLSTELRTHIGSILKDFVEDTSVSKQMILMALEDRSPDISAMTQWFHSQEYDVATLPIDLSALVQTLVDNLASELMESASSSESHLFNRVNIGLMKQIKQMLAQQVAAPSLPNVFEMSLKTSKRLITHSLQHPIPRDGLLEELFEFSISGNGVIVGQPGVGKSYLLYRLSQTLISRGHACICFPVAGNQSRTDLKTALDINVDPIDYLKTIIHEQDSAVGIRLYRK